MNIPPALPNLEFIAKLGEGGMSSVWKAHDYQREETVAVKILNHELSASSDDIELFRAEARTMSDIHHIGIVRSYELNCFLGVWYYTMEYVDGYNFSTLLDRKQHLAEADCLLICESVAVALDYAWNDFGVVHCDIKPDNIMINSEGIVKLTDLGLCHTFQYLKDGAKDVPDHVMGTPAYISPEQVYGDVEPDCRADIYSLAASLYHLSTGRTLFPGLGSEDMMRAHCDEERRAHDPRRYRPELSEGFCQLLEAMLVKNRDYRLTSWQDVCRMCLEVERGIAFKPRVGAVSSILLDSPAPDATGAETSGADLNAATHSQVPQPKKRVLRVLRSGGNAQQGQKKPGHGKLVIKKSLSNSKFKIHPPADW